MNFTFDPILAFREANAAIQTASGRGRAFRLRPADTCGVAL
jgi:hypothetical protein